MRNFLAFAAAAATQAFADTIVMPPIAGASGEEVAIVWIHGMQCDPQGYTALASEIQSNGAQNNQKIWVGLPEFLFDAPEPILIGSNVKDTLE